MDAETFEKWFKGILEKIEPGSVIVLDNAPYHSRRLERIPNMSWRKADIQGWLTEKNIQFEEKEIKAQLLAKFDKETYQKKYIDELAASKQILVLRLPPYHCELNPIELIWAQIKGYVGRHNKTFKLDAVEELLKDGISRIGTESWKKCVEHIKKKEDEMMRLDGIIDDLTDKPTPEFVIHVGESSSSEDFDRSGSE
ncbi:DDE superfamily endonuclease domain-containing protein [Phthorimaea operculella]|nr:DDE superfamily endonuclease domain-containing protein [Phthorimaea operculella]